ncbi:hypothetical protein D3C80_1914280 [compost metagenome]
MPQHLAPCLGQHRVAGLAIKQADAKIGLKVGNGGADGGLALAQFARCRRKGPQGNRFDEGLQRFR